MPSRWIPQRSRRSYDPGGRITASEGRELSGTRVRSIQAPWGGFTPDLAPELTTWQDSEVLQNMMARQGLLGPMDGYVKVTGSPTTLPLGTNTPPAGAGNEEPVVGLFQFIDSTGVKRQYAVTAHAVLGHLYSFNTGSWTNIPAAAAITFTGDASGAGVAQTLCDAVYHTPSGRIIFANNFNRILEHVPGAANYSELASGALAPFLARSVEVADGRILFLNTSETGTRFQNRVRWTVVGGTRALTGLGSGFLDLDELDGPGLRLRKLGNVIVAYFERGVAFLRRRVSASTPYTREYVDRRRGLIGPFSACDIGQSAHFGIYTDGWFILTEDKVFREVGRRLIGGQSHRKFTDNFYSRLNTAQQHRTYVECDLERRIVSIVFPTVDNNHPSERWFYDIDTDTVWPAQEAITPNVLGRFDDNITEIGWDDVGGTWEAISGAWEDFAQQTGRLRIAAGTRGGLVWRYTPAVVTYDGVLPTYRMRSFPDVLGVGSSRKIWERFYVNYERIDGNPSPIGVELHTQSQAVRSANLTQMLGLAGTRQLDYIHSDDPGGDRLAWEIAGVHPLKVVRYEANYRLEGIQQRRVR